MKKIELSLNILHYCIYLLHYKLHLLFSKVNPFTLIHKLPFQKRRYAELGIDIREEIDKAFSDQRFGLSVTIAGGALIGIIFIFIMGTVQLAIRLMNLNIDFTTPYFVAFALITIIPCYFYVLGSNKYLKYFKKFETWPTAERRKNIYLSIGFIILVICIFWGSLTI